MATVETSGKTVEEAVRKAADQLGVEPADLEVEVLSEGKGGLFGLGGGGARVRAFLATPGNELDEDELAEPDDGEEEEDQEPAYDERYDARGRLEFTPRIETAKQLRPVEGTVQERGTAVLQNLLDLMEIRADVTPREPTTAGDGVGHVSVVLDVEGDDLGLLIGRRGETLASIQYIVNLILMRQAGEKAIAGVDVAGYKRRREESLTTLANRMAEQVKATGRTITLEPMPANERRIVHLALAESEDVTTASVGEGDYRKVALSPRA
ncbi:MAG: RNA-binding cell elongation regulator Jag/EloR [Dehalococcoidia bacterium]